MISFSVKLRVAGASTHGHGHRLWLRLRRRLRPGFWHRLSFWHRDRLGLWLPIRQTHKIFLHPLVTHEFGIHANRNVSDEKPHVTIIVTRRPDAAAIFQRSYLFPVKPTLPSLFFSL